MKYLPVITSVFLILAGLNWGLIAAFHINPVDLAFGGTMVDSVIYLLFGISALVKIVELVPFKIAKEAETSL